MKKGLRGFIRNATFELSGVVTVIENGVRILDLTGWTARSQIRTEEGVLIADLTVQFLNAATSLIRVFTLAPTGQWPLGVANMNILMISPSGVVVPTGVSSFNIEQGVTV